MTPTYNLTNKQSTSYCQKIKTCLHRNYFKAFKMYYTEISHSINAQKSLCLDAAKSK